MKESQTVFSLRHTVTIGRFDTILLVVTSDGATRRMSPTSSPRSVSNENRFQFLVYRESKITYHIPDKQLKLSQKHKCGDFMWLNTVMSSCV